MKKSKIKENRKEDDYIHYLYKITNLLNGDFYIGIHSLLKNSNKTPLNDGYWGSGVKIRKEINKIGRKSFSKEIIKIYSTREELIAAEKAMVTLNEVLNPKCYNLCIGGQASNKNLGFVTCRLKSFPDKIVRISKEIYYNNKDLFIVTGHFRKLDTEIKKLSLKEKKEKDKLRMKKNYSYKRKQKINDKDRFYNRKRFFINRNTLEIKLFIGHDEPEDLFKNWFPIEFYDKNNSKFISIEYFYDLYKKFGTIKEISAYTGVSLKKISRVKNYYINNGLKIDFKLKRNDHDNKRFSNKLIINKNGKELVIDKENLDHYLSLGYLKGKDKSYLNKEKILKFYLAGNNLKLTAKEFKTSPEVIKEIIGINSQNSYNIWFHNEEGTIIHLLLTEDMIKTVINNGWFLGRKNKP